MRLIILESEDKVGKYAADVVLDRIQEKCPTKENPFVLGLPTGLPKNHPESYHHYMWENFFSKIDILAENVHILNGNADDLKMECKKFEEEITKAGGVDLCIGGIGPDGHIAFNEPGSSLSSRTRVKTLAYDTIRANARFFDNDITKVPTRALTVGVGTVMDSKEYDGA
ncbi:hypothetical protein QYM36_010831 [Artemia franciscana]|uniref:Glucosamine-6-phosphate deaminase n=1 Tax=Artemia franciscana TaxID=6661 RepID=A0AA88HY77_ARTSF|nr:hypothetical protein QYM36_010831 [Artemia franciscana]